MPEKTNLQILCTEKIPALLRGVPAKEVFKDRSQTQPEKKIEKPWAVYKGVMFFPIGIGLIVKEAERGTLYIQYSERGSEECWDPTYVSRFGTPTEAASYFVERREGVLEKKLNRLYGNFPKFIKKEKLEELHNLLVQRRNSLIAQSSPKCTTFGESLLVTEERIRSGELAEGFDGSLHETYTKDKPQNPNIKY